MVISKIVCTFVQNQYNTTMKIKNLTLSTILIVAPLCGIHAAQVIYNTPSNYQVLSMSPNGQWACGVYTDANNTPYGFRWNLNTGSIEMLDPTDESTAWDIANDGTVSGTFGDTSITPNHAPIQMVGFYRDGKWNSVEKPAEKIGDGVGYGITPDGHYISGAVNINGVYTPCIWKDGKLDQILPTNPLAHAMPYVIAPDGQSAAGWIMKSNRVACYWTPEGNTELMLDSPEYSYFYNNCGKNFSPDGKTLLYWGGWDVDGDDLYLWALYDVATGERKRIKAPSMSSTMEFFDISNDGVLVGSETERGYVYVSQEDKCYYIDDYLEKCGVDLDEVRSVFYEGEYWDNSTLPISRVASISEDSKTIALLYWDKTQQQSSMVIKMDVDPEKCVPSELVATQLKGLCNVGVTWKPQDNAAGCSYMVYRDGKRVSGGLPLRNTYFYDKNVEAGSHTYLVELITPSGTRNMSDPVEINVSRPELSSPLSLSVRQKGIYDARMSWAAPLGNKTIKTYADYNNQDVLGFSVYEDVKMEAAIKFDAHEIANYSGYKLDEVAFIPLHAHKSWTVNVYSQSPTDGTLTLLTSQPVNQSLVYGERNSVRLDNLVELPVQGNVIVAVAVDVDSQSYTTVLGADMGPVKAGYTDLLRQGDDGEFFSAYDSSVASGFVCTCMTWMIDASFTPDGYSDEDNALMHYNIYADGAKVSQTTELGADVPHLADGTHTLGVQAQYANGSVSEITSANIDIAARYPAVNEVEITTNIDEKSVKAEWSAPYDCDSKSITYNPEKTAIQGISGISANGYAIMAATDYPSNMFTGYDGYRIKSLRFYPLTDAVFSLVLYCNGEEVYYVEVDDYKLNQWNEVELTDEILVEKGCSYRLLVDCFDPTPEVNVLALDSSPCFPMVSDLYSINNGESFSTLSIDSGLNGSWMMSIELESTDATYLDVDGYDIRIDGNVVNDSKLTSTEFEYVMPDADTRRHSLKIDTYYKDVDKAVSSPFYYFTLNPLGITDGIVTDITLKEGDNYLLVEGDNVKSLAVISMTGTRVAYAESNSVSISSLIPGVYVVAIELEGGKSLTRKIAIH